MRPDPKTSSTLSLSPEAFAAHHGAPPLPPTSANINAAEPYRQD